LNALLNAALRCARLGYRVFPCQPGGKAPLTPHGFLDASSDMTRIEAWWAKHPDANVGMPTAGLVVIDIDGANNPWPGDPDKVAALANAVTSRTPRGGGHYIFRQPSGKSLRSTAGRIAPHVDTRANGGYILLPPSVVDGRQYQWAEATGLTGPEDLPEPPEWLIALLDSADTTIPPDASPNADTPIEGGARLGEGNVIPHGQRNATLARLAGTMRRAGMSREEILAALMRANEDRCRPPLLVGEVERIATSIARYEPDQVAVAVAENHWAQDVQQPESEDENTSALSDPGPLPVELLRVPGFISEVMDHCLETAPYPNPAMAFAGALALQAVLAGRKVRDPGDNRTNIYLLGLAHSSAGKDRPRKINAEILHSVGLADQIGGSFASGEGIQDALFACPCMVFQTDEIDGMLQSINKARDARHENIMTTLLMMYSSANSVFPMRRKAGRDSAGTIDQPCLVVFGTAIPNHYYEALSERMLTNGFFARMIVLECGTRSAGREPRILPLPERVLGTAKWWADFKCGTGNLETWHPVPQVIRQTAAAKEVLVATRLGAEAEYAKAEGSDDSVGTAVWGRASEHARKLALIYAVSENHQQPEIGRAATEWASRLVLHQARRMLFMAQSHVADNPFQGECLRFLRKLRSAPGGTLSHSVLLKRMKMDAKGFLGLVTTLEQRGDVVIETCATATKSGRFYKLAERIQDDATA